MAPESRARILLAALARHANSDSVDWLGGALPQPNKAFRRSQYFGAYAGAGRRFRQLDWHLEARDCEALREVGLIDPARWSPDELARAALLLAASEALPAEEHAGVVEEAFRKGDSAERCALLKSLALLPGSQRFLKTATEASRAQVQEVFEAIACENAYPAMHFPELNFNQLVLKALFLEVPLARVHEWRPRCNPELGRMVSDYEAERVAARRSVPTDIADIRRTIGAL
ncbi:MAG: hypothetical protein DRH30_07975 [Deltaproteobacteria bacterium]|nr:MAG: hypothetical protein DRH30_07975 [Deltaproteobacteria bacterium]